MTDTVTPRHLANQPNRLTETILKPCKGCGAADLRVHPLDTHVHPQYAVIGYHSDDCPVAWGPIAPPSAASPQDAVSLWNARN